MSSSSSSKKDGFKNGPLEQALAVLIVIGAVAQPNVSFGSVSGPRATGGSYPLFSPLFVMLVIVAYVGYVVLERQKAARERQEAENKAKAKAKAAAAAKAKPSSSSSSSASQKPLTSKDVAKGLPPSKSSSSSKGPSPPKAVSKSGSSTAVTQFGLQKHYFLTMQGPGRPALVPFQHGLKPKEGEADSTMWWDNVPDDAGKLMAPPPKPSSGAPPKVEPKPDRMMMLLEDEMAQQKAKFEKVGTILQSILGLLLCLIDVRLGFGMFAFFLWRHFTALADAERSPPKKSSSSSSSSSRR